MITARTILDCLRSMAGDKPRIIVLHSTLYPFRLSETEFKWPLLRALDQLIVDGHTIAVPTFTFEFCKTGRFDIRRSRPETGQLGRMVMELSAFRRSAHPIYSFAVAGSRADEILRCQGDTTFSLDSPFGLFDREDARLVMFGCGWDVCTQFHFYEEEVRVPYRLYKTFEPAPGENTSSAKMFVRDLEIGARNDFSAVVRALDGKHAISRATLGEGQLEACDCSDFAAVCRSLLKADPYAFVASPPETRRREVNLHRRNENAPVRVALLGSSNVETLAAALRSTLEDLVPDRRIQMYRAGYGQAIAEAMTPDSALQRFAPDFVFFVDRLEDIYQVASLPAVDALERGKLDLYIDAVAACATRLQATTFAATFKSPQPTGFSSVDPRTANSNADFVATANASLKSRLGALPNAYIVDIESASADGPMTDERLWFLGRFPFAAKFSEKLASRLAGLVLAALGKTARLLVLDLDNTLWGGVLGEDGVEGLALGGDFPGNAYRHFQSALRELSARGIALAIVSKNDEKDALAAINSLPHMLIRESDLAGWRIGWADKSVGVAALAQDLGLGLGTVAFIDDNPAERMRMRMALPDVTVIELPDDPAGYARAVLESPYLACLSVTAEDRKRAKSYVQKRKLDSERTSFADDAAFLRHLQPRVQIARRDAHNAQRVLQLMAKTNQFNTTLRRFTAPELDAFETAGGGVYVIALADRYSELENIGVIAVGWGRERAVIDPFLLSCRILGRGVETAVLAWLVNEARGRGIAQIVGKVVEAPRNEPARDVYRNHGFAAGHGAGEWIYETRDISLVVPDWVALGVDTRQAAHA
jgi:FkbH-like protein